MAAHLLLYAQGGVESTLRMMLVRHRCPEQREDAVAGGLHEIPLVTRVLAL
jgi:hypothetical protein